MAIKIWNKYTHGKLNGKVKIKLRLENDNKLVLLFEGDFVEGKKHRNMEKVKNIIIIFQIS